MILDVLFTVVLPTVLVLIAGIALSRHRTTVSDGEFDSDSVSFAGGVLSALFTVVLAFYIVFAWQQGADIDSTATAESNAVVDIYWQAADIDAPARDTVRGLLREYAGRVADDEWGELAQGRVDPRTPEIVREIRAALTALPADGGIVESARELGLQDLRVIDESRRARVDGATGGDVFTTVLLIGTIIGAALMIGFPLLVGVSARPVNLVVLALLTLTVCATVFISVQLTHPLDGPFGVGPDAFRDALGEMRPST